MEMQVILSLANMPVCFQFIGLKKKKKMTGTAFLPFKRVIGQYSSIPGRFARNLDCSKGSYLILP